ncbi:MAG: anion permease, partial [Calditrichaeota bacterium]
MIVFILLILGTIFLAYSNGANDNFKGVATLFGCGTAKYRGAITWATLTTFAGSVVSIFLSRTLIKSFSGKGLVPDAVAASPEFLLAVALGAAITVMLATATGFPISTTHSLTGGLVGAGIAAVGVKINFAFLGHSFFLPLLFSPFIALSLSTGLYPLLRAVRVKMGISKEWCVCMGETEQTIPIPQPVTGSSLSVSGPKVLTAAFAPDHVCAQKYTGKVIGLSAQKLLDIAHYASAGMVSFARGLNDTPKIIALLLVVKAIGLESGMLAIAIGMALGGLLNARKVAMTLGKKITPLNHGQGFTANIVTSFLVIVASRLGLPVSTTHVSVGSLFGIGLANRQGNARVVSEILMSWILTLPIAAVLSALFYG